MTLDAGFETIGNATLICYDGGPVLVTDPWILGSAYFGSWTRSHEIPEAQMEAIKKCEYLWVSHGHPDHLDVGSLRSLGDKKVLLPDHVGGRIASDLTQLGFNVTVLKDRVWTRLSPRISCLTIPDYNQDAVLLVDIDGTLLVNLNDASPLGWGPFVQKTIRSYKESFLLKLFGYGDVDMINFFDEDGVRIEPTAALRLPVGRKIAQFAESFGVKYVIPFSSMHKYQRSDSVWANQYTTPLEDYGIGFKSSSSELLPAFVRYDCLSQNLEEINPAATPDVVVDPKKFDDDWSEPLGKKEFQRLSDYFKSISHLQQVVDFINFRVGDEDNVIEIRPRNFQKGIIFALPRRSLMRAIRYEIFDDLLIGNFMKTTLIGEWSESRLYPDFAPYVGKYADNGQAKTPEELRKYFREYRQRAPIDYLRNLLERRLVSAARSRIDADSELYQWAKKTWLFVNRRLAS